MQGHRARKAGAMMVVCMLLTSASLDPADCCYTPPAANARGTSGNPSTDGTVWCGIADGTRFSGTCGSVRGKWLANSDGSLKKVQLWVNGVKRYEKTWSSGYPSQWPSGSTCTSWLSVPWSSTQFAHSTTLTFTAKLWTTLNPTTTISGTDPRSHQTWNRAWVAACPEYNTWETRAGYARSFFVGAGHTTTSVHTTKTAAQIEADIPNYSAFHYTGHGDSKAIADCTYRSGDPPTDANCVTQDPPSETEISTAIAQKSSSQCQYNFVFLDTCYSGASSNLKNAFGTTSFIGWDGVMTTGESYETFVDTFYDSLAEEGTVGSSAIDAYNASDLDHFAVWGGTYYVHRTY